MSSSFLPIESKRRAAQHDDNQHPGLAGQVVRQPASDGANRVDDGDDGYVVNQPVQP
jgi:hypothetical protein